MIARFGSPSPCRHQDAEERAEILQRYTEEIMCRIACCCQKNIRVFIGIIPLKEFAV
jgi:hypothetical protein